MERTSSSDHANLDFDLNAHPMHFYPTQTPHEEVMEELNKMKWENKKLNELLFTIMCTNYHDFKKSELNQASRKRKSCEIENFNACDECSPKEMRSNVSRAHVRIDPSDTTLVVKDGYQWRKYGQKVTRDNPSPRAYYKCSMAPSCSVKKKVQRSASDPSLLVATYEGQHNHRPSGDEIGVISSPIGCSGCANSPISSPIGCSGCASKSSIGGIQELVVEQMASSLTRNHSFTEALIAAITGRILDDVSDQNYEDTLSNSRVFSG